jgi:hypothetical protein
VESVPEQGSVLRVLLPVGAERGFGGVAA